MKIHNLIHEQSCRIDSVEETLRKENEMLAEMQNLQMMINQFVKAKSDKKLYVWLVDNDYDLSAMQMNLLDEIVI